MKKQCIPHIILILICCSFLFACTSTSENDIYYDSSYDSSSVQKATKITLSERESLAESAIIIKLIAHIEDSSYSRYNADMTKYEIGSIKQDDDKFIIYGKLYFYDSYGDFARSEKFHGYAYVSEYGDVSNSFATIE